MPLPNPGMSFTPFDPLPASDLNDLVENIEALEDGSAPITSLSQATTAFSNPYKFRTTNTGYTYTGAGVDQKVPFPTENFDTNSNFDATTNYRYTAPVSGFYQFNAALIFSSGGTLTGRMALYKNGSVYARSDDSTPQAGSKVGVTYSDFIQLTAADYVEIWVLASTNTGVDSAFFSGYLVCKT